MTRIAVVLGLLGVAGHAVVAGQGVPPKPADALIVSLRVDDLSPGSGGGSGAVEWLHRLPQGLVILGAETFSLAGSGWTLAKVGIAGSASPAMSVRAEAQAGPGWAGSRFFYRRMVGGVAYQAIAHRLYVDLEQRYVHAERLEDYAIQPGVLVHLGGGASARAAYGHSLGGNYDSEYLLVSGDYAYRRSRVFGGASVGRSGPDLLEPGGVAPSRSSYQLFGGITVPLRRLEFTIGVSRWARDDDQRYSLLLASRIPAP